MLETIKVSTLFSPFASVGILFFSLIGYRNYTTVGPSHKLRDTTKEHTRMRELRIVHVHNDHNHNQAEHIH